MNEVLKLAKSQVGYLEKQSSNSLYDKISDAGDKNYTKYWSEMNPSFQGQPWCLCFIVWLFDEAYGPKKAKNMLYMPSYTYYTPTAAQGFQKNDAWFPSPQIGDLIFFKNSTRIFHVGIVYNVDNNKVYTYEGNTSSGNQVIENGGGVFAKEYLLTNSKIAGYGRPNYAGTASVTPTPAAASKGIDVSHYQGTILWDQVKKSNIDFTILKIMNKQGNVEKNFEYNYANASLAGIKVEGVYNYSYATSINDAINDANRVIQILGERKPCVWLDVEDECQKNLGAKLIEIILAYKNIIIAAGCEFGIYTGLSFYNSYIKPYISSLGDTKFWIARYGKNNGQLDATYKPNINNLYIWQYTSEGTVPGVSGKVDMNIKCDSNIVTNTQNYNVKVTVSALNIRSGPSTDYHILSTIRDRGIYTISETQNGWGKLAYNQGWICLQYTEKI